MIKHARDADLFFCRLTTMDESSRGGFRQNDDGVVKFNDLKKYQSQMINTTIHEIMHSIQNDNKTMSIEDRKQAIKTACQFATSNDIILIAGKGHETYQEVNGVKNDFDDLKVVKELLINVKK